VGFLLFLLVGNFLYKEPFTVEGAFTDYHQVGHTYTPLWSYTSHDATRWNYNSTCISFDDSAVPNKAIEFQYTLGEAMNTDISLDSYADANRDTSSSITGVWDSDVAAPNGEAYGQAFEFTTGGTKQLVTSKFSLSKVGSPVGNLASQVYLGDTADVATAKPTGSSLGESASVAMAGLPTSPTFTVTSFAFTNGPPLAVNTVYVIIVFAKDATTLDGSNRPLVGIDNSAPTHQGTSSGSTNIGSWSVTAYDLIFEVVGQATQLGANCASASTIISKASINLQSVSGRQLVGIMQWNLTNSLNRGTQWQMFLRTNGTLPAFNEGWVASADERVRLLWRSNAGDTSGTQYNYVPRGSTNSIDDEGVDTIVQTQAWTAAAAATGIEFDMVLNFTGPRNVMYRFAGQTDGINNFFFTETDFQSQLQLGQDYFVGFNVIWDTTIAPAGTSEARLLIGTNEFQSGQFNTPLHIDGVPAMCNDTKNTEGVNCPAPSGGTRVFDVRINPLDPSSWANAIIKGMVWAAGVAFEYLLGFGAFFANLILNGLDAIGQWAGVGNVGTNIRTFFTGISSWLSNIFGIAISWISTFVSITAAGIGFITNFFSGSNPFVAFLISFFGWLPNIWTLVTGVWDEFLRWYNSGVFTIGAILMVWWTLGEYQVYMDGIPGLMSWLSLTETFTVKIVKAAFTLAKESWGILLTIKQMVTGWT